MVSSELRPFYENEAFEDDAKTTRTLNNIRKTLKTALEEHGSVRHLASILKVHGLHKSNFDFVANIENTINQKLNDISIDDNSNKEDKTIEAIHQEIFAAGKKAIGYDMLYRMIKEMYGKEEAKRLTGKMYDFSIALADSTNILKVYCYAVNANHLVISGRPFGQLHSGPCQRVSSYISALSETIHQLASHLAGAIAVGSFFFDIAHLMMYKQSVSIQTLKNNQHIRKNLGNEFQQFIHSVNHLSRNSNESPFTNVSIFDRVKLRAIIKDMEWYFPDTDVEKVVEYVLEIQDVFLDLFDAGDPLKNGAPYRFPIVTVNLSKSKSSSVLDKEMLDDICNRDIYRYNIFTSEGTKVASCCRLINDVEMMEYAGQANSFGAGGSINLGSHRVATINFNRIALEARCIDHYYQILDKRIEDTAKILAAHKQLIKLTSNKGLQMFLNNGWMSMNRLFSTFGIIGIVEAAETMIDKLGINEGDRAENITQFKTDVLTFLNRRVEEVSKKHGLIGNIEQIPGESMAVKLANVDKMLFGRGQVKYTMYSNQFIPLWKDCSVWEKFEEDGRYNQLITGGGIVHAQINDQVTSTQAKKLIRYAVKSGCEHFALNSVYSECDNKHTSLGKFDTCPVCGKDISSYFTRVVGFFTRVDAWNSTRREWEFPKRTFVDLKDL